MASQKVAFSNHSSSAPAKKRLIASRTPVGRRSQLMIVLSVG